MWNEKTPSFTVFMIIQSESYKVIINLVNHCPIKKKKQK